MLLHLPERLLLRLLLLRQLPEHRLVFLLVVVEEFLI
jgi:hypothetical protein